MKWRQPPARRIRTGGCWVVATGWLLLGGRLPTTLRRLLLLLGGVLWLAPLVLGGVLWLAPLLLGGVL